MRWMQPTLVRCVLLVLLVQLTTVAASAREGSGTLGKAPFRIGRQADVTISVKRTPGTQCQDELCPFDLLANNTKLFSSSFPPRFTYAAGFDGPELVFTMSPLPQKEDLQIFFGGRFKASKKRCEVDRYTGEIPLRSSFKQTIDNKAGWIKSTGCFYAVIDIRRRIEPAR